MSDLPRLLAQRIEPALTEGTDVPGLGPSTAALWPRAAHSGRIESSPS